MMSSTTQGAAGQLVAILDKGDDYARLGDSRSAVSFYQSALTSSLDPRTLDPELVGRLRAAKAYIDQQMAEFQRRLEEVAAEAPKGTAVESLRIAHTTDFALGKRQIYLSEPTVLFTPYLAQRQFFEREEFPWAAEMEAATDDICGELLAMIDGGQADFRPYVVDPENRPGRPGLPLNNDPSWSALYLWRDGAIVPEVAERCPKTMAALAKVPMSTIGRRTPIALFSRLTPGAHIPPHHGMLNCRIVCHLPLIVPPGCTLRVGNETREWKSGELMMFDDTFEHEARNPTGEVRIILLFDVWRPELGEAERAAISQIFDAIDDFQGTPSEA